MGGFSLPTLLVPNSVGRRAHACSTWKEIAALLLMLWASVAAAQPWGANNIPNPRPTFQPAAPYEPASVRYERHTPEMVKNGSTLPYLLGGILRPSCLAPGGSCNKEGIWSQICTFRRPMPVQDKGPQTCHNAPDYSRDRVRDLLVGMQTRYSKWLPPDVPGPSQLTPNDLWAEIRGGGHSLRMMHSQFAGANKFQL
jgi:hypothetical protein